MTPSAAHLSKEIVGRKDLAGCRFSALDKGSKLHVPNLPVLRRGQTAGFNELIHMRFNSFEFATPVGKLLYGVGHDVLALTAQAIR